MSLIIEGRGVKMNIIEPKLVEIKNGWAVVDSFWAVFGRTKDEAISKYEIEKSKHEEISKRSLKDNQIISANVP